VSDLKPVGVWTIVEWCLCIVAMVCVLGLALYVVLPWITNSPLTKVKVAKRYVGEAGRTAWVEGLVETGMNNITLRDGEDSTVQLNPCDYMYCSDPSKLGWADAYICYVIDGTYTMTHCSGGMFYGPPHTKTGVTPYGATK